jgi:hypothetical protein
MIWVLGGAGEGLGILEGLREGEAVAGEAEAVEAAEAAVGGACSWRKHLHSWSRLFLWTTLSTVFRQRVH